MKLLLVLFALLLPADDAKRDPSFVAYRDLLLEAVHNRDEAMLMKLVDPKMRTGFGGEGGPKELLQQVKEHDLWPELEWIVTHGGSWRAGTFCAPYVYSNWPESNDAFQSLAVTGKGVALRAQPKTGRVLTRLSYDIVTIAGAEKDGWRRVKTAGGRTGWMSTAYLRSPIGYRACFGKTAEGWKMQLLVAGD
jgi:hypothetical protein